MALNGINLALAWSGQEAIWQRVRVHPPPGPPQVSPKPCVSTVSSPQRIRAPEVFVA